jgi:hypothetical protein
MPTAFLKKPATPETATVITDTIKSLPVLSRSYRTYWIINVHMLVWWPGSLVGIATGYGLDGPGIESLWRARFSAPVQTGPRTYPAFCTMGTGSFLGVKSGRAGPGRPAQPRPTALLSPRSNGKIRGCYCSYWTPDDGREDARNMLSCTLT